MNEEPDALRCVGSGGVLDTDIDRGRMTELIRAVRMSAVIAVGMGCHGLYPGPVCHVLFCYCHEGRIYLNSVFRAFGCRSGIENSSTGQALYGSRISVTARA